MAMSNKTCFNNLVHICQAYINDNSEISEVLKNFHGVKYESGTRYFGKYYIATSVKSITNPLTGEIEERRRPFYFIYNPYLKCTICYSGTASMSGDRLFYSLENGKLKYVPPYEIPYKLYNAIYHCTNGNISPDHKENDRPHMYLEGMPLFNDYVEYETLEEPRLTNPNKIDPEVKQMVEYFFSKPENLESTRCVLSGKHRQFVNKTDVFYNPAFMYVHLFLNYAVNNQESLLNNNKLTSTFLVDWQIAVEGSLYLFYEYCKNFRNFYPFNYTDKNITENLENMLADTTQRIIKVLSDKRYFSPDLNISAEPFNRNLYHNTCKISMGGKIDELQELYCNALYAKVDELKVKEGIIAKESSSKQMQKKIESLIAEFDEEQKAKEEKQRQIQIANEKAQNEQNVKAIIKKLIKYYADNGYLIKDIIKNYDKYAKDNSNIKLSKREYIEDSVLDDSEFIKYYNDTLSQSFTKTKSFANEINMVNSFFKILDEELKAENNITQNVNAVYNRIVNKPNVSFGITEETIKTTLNGLVVPESVNSKTGKLTLASPLKNHIDTLVGKVQLLAGKDDYLNAENNYIELEKEIKGCYNKILNSVSILTKAIDEYKKSISAYSSTCKYNATYINNLNLELNELAKAFLNEAKIHAKNKNNPNKEALIADIKKLCEVYNLEAQNRAVVLKKPVEEDQNKVNVFRSRCSDLTKKYTKYASEYDKIKVNFPNFNFSKISLEDVDLNNLMGENIYNIQIGNNSEVVDKKLTNIENQVASGLNSVNAIKQRIADLMKILETIKSKFIKDCDNNFSLINAEIEQFGQLKVYLINSINEEFEGKVTEEEIMSALNGLESVLATTINDFFAEINNKRVPNLSDEEIMDLLGIKAVDSTKKKKPGSFGGTE